ncbi:MAG: hypothetical protein OXP66_08220 [Candidatus Tectomicrobia bacterium]|nr:hypothetical protein [Candidatus Tectomicrobia bacterium]
MTAAAILVAAMLYAAPADPPRVWLGLNCDPGVDRNGDQIAYAVSLPDDVLTECEGEPRHER